MSWYVYVIKCKDNTLYTGITSNLGHRIQKHNTGHGCRYTKYRPPVTLLHSEQYSSKPEALKREAYIKGLERKKKLSLC